MAVIPTPTPEVATVAVLNGTIRAGFAGATANRLRDHGIDVAYVDNADHQNYATTTVVVYQEKPLTLERVLRTLDVGADAVVYEQDPESAYDIVVILGEDSDGGPS